MINDWSGIDKAATVEFILSSVSYEGAFGQRPHLEAHGGSTYCAVASLAIMGHLNDGTITKDIKDRVRFFIPLFSMASKKIKDSV